MPEIHPELPDVGHGPPHTPIAETMLALHRAGYSPMPTTAADSKVPGLQEDMPRWQAYCQQPATADLIEAWAATADGVTVALGYGGLLALDVDTDCPRVAAAIASVLPPSPSRKRGATGRTLFYRDPTGTIKTRRFKPVGMAKPIVEVLATGAHTVLPPTAHRDTGRPYVWEGQPLHDFSVEDLPEITPAHVDAIEAALAPFLGRENPKKSRLQADQAQERKPANRHESSADFMVWKGDPKQLTAWVRSLLKTKTAELASMAGGRNPALFDLGCQFGRYVHGGVITAEELQATCRDAYAACGALEEHGEQKFKATIANALKRTAGDALTVPKAIARKLRGERAVSTGWTSFPNALANDTRLDAPSLVVLTYRTSKRDDEWALNVKKLKRIARDDGRCGLGRDRAQAAISDLAKKGYIERYQPKKGQGEEWPFAKERLKVPRPEKDFAQIPNRLFDGQFTVNAMATVIFVAASKSVFVSEIAKRFEWSRQTASKAVKEAIDGGFLKRLPNRQIQTNVKITGDGDVKITGDGIAGHTVNTSPQELPVEGRRRQPPTELEDTYGNSCNVIHVDFGRRSHVF